jgi:hypothetical protein
MGNSFSDNVAKKQAIPAIDAILFPEMSAKLPNPAGSSPGQAGVKLHGRCTMNEAEVLEQIKAQRNDKHHFVKWWRIEDDFLDYDLIERFIANASDTVMAGFELLTMDEMWSEIKRIAGERVNFKHDPASGNSRVEWVYEGKNGVKKQICLYTPETLMTIFDVETKGNPVD